MVRAARLEGAVELRGLAVVYCLVELELLVLFFKHGAFVGVGPKVSKLTFPMLVSVWLRAGFRSVFEPVARIAFLPLLDALQLLLVFCLRLFY